MRLPLLVLLLVGLWSRTAIGEGLSPWFLPDVNATELIIPNDGQIVVRSPEPSRWGGMVHYCRFWLQSGKSRVRLEQVDTRALRHPGYQMITLRTKRPLKTHHTYRFRFSCYDQTESVRNRNGVPVHVRASGKEDEAPPVWAGVEPRFYSREIIPMDCGTNAPPETILKFTAPSDESQVSMHLTLWNPFLSPRTYKLAVDGQHASLIEYGEILGHECTHAILCGVDAAGNESCAGPIVFNPVSDGQNMRECSMPQAFPATVRSMRKEPVCWKNPVALAAGGLLLLVLIRLRRRRRWNAARCLALLDSQHPTGK